MKKVIPILLLGLAAAASLPTYATPISITMDLGTLFTGSTPAGSAPWLTATFISDTTSKTGTLTLTSDLSGEDFVGGPNIGWGFNLNTGVSSLACASGNCADNAQSGGSYNAGPLQKDWNLAFEWLAGDRFVKGNTAVYNITFDSLLANGSPFTTNTDHKVGGWLSVAHVQGIGTAGSCSGWIVAGDGQGALGDDGKCGTPPTNVPEPSALGMFGLGTLMIGLLVGLRRRRYGDRNSGSF